MMPLRRPQGVERADHFAQQISGNLGVQRGRIEPLVAKQGLDDPDVNLLLQQMGGEAVAQDVHGHALVDPRQVGGGVDGAVQLPCAERIDGILSGGNNQPPCSILPSARAVFHHARRQSSSAGDSMA